MKQKKAGGGTGNNNQTVSAKNNNSGVIKAILTIAAYYLFFIIFIAVNAGFVWASILSFILSLLVLTCFNLFAANSDSDRIVKILLVLFILTLAVGCFTHKTKDIEKIEQTAGFSGSETVNVGPGQHFSKVSFPVGREFRMTVTGDDVNFIHDSTVVEKLTENNGTYTYVSTKEGVLEFSSEKPTTLTIDW